MRMCDWSGQRCCGVATHLEADVLGRLQGVVAVRHGYDVLVDVVLLLVDGGGALLNQHLQRTRQRGTRQRYDSEAYDSDVGVRRDEACHTRAQAPAPRTCLNL